MQIISAIKYTQYRGLTIVHQRDLHVYLEVIVYLNKI